jgi:tetratricopeptide (TPR) repeat protein
VKLLFPTEPRERSAVGAWLLERGFALASDQAVTWGTRGTGWRRDDDYVEYMTRGRAATVTLRVVGPNEGAIAAEISGLMPTRSTAEVLRGPNGEGDRAVIAHAFALGTVAFLVDEAAAEAKRALFGLLLDDREFVRWAALEAVAPSVDEEVVDAVAAAAERHAELVPAHARIKSFWVAREDGTLGDHDTDDRYELLSRAREGAQAGKWRRVAKAMDALLAESPWDAEGLYLRALAHEGEGELLQALFLLGAAEPELVGSERLQRVAARGEEGDDDDDVESDEEEVEDADISNDTIAVAREKLAALRERTGDESAEARAQVIAWATRYLHEWESRMQVGAVHGGAKALHGKLPELDPLFAFIVGRYDGDEAMLRTALEGAPDAPSVLLAIAHAVLERDEAEGLGKMHELRERLREPAELSPAARAIEDFVAARGDKYRATEASIVEILAKRAYDAKSYDEAAVLADELCVLDPNTGLGWQLRANARIFALKHEESIAAYDDAIAALDRIYAKGKEEGSIFFGDDARPGMFFNRGCAQAKVGRKKDALESLRVAIRESEKYAAMAVEDDYLESLFEDPEFKAIVARDPRALRSVEERDPAWIKSLIARSRDEQQAGDVQKGLATATRAAELAGFLDERAVLAEALAVLGRMQAFMGSVDTGLETTARAVELARADDVPPDVRALVSAQRGICLQASGDLEAAEAAYLEAFEARRAAFGEDHPVLVKSMVSVAGVALERDRPAAEVEGLLGRGIDIATRFLEKSPPKDHVWAEAIDDLVSLLVRRTLLRQRAGDIAGALPPLALAMDRLDEQRASGFLPMAAVLEQVRSFADALAGGAESTELAAAAAQVRRRAEDQLIPGPPEERAARLVFRNVKALVAQLRAGGVEDERIASTLQEVVRGGAGLPEEVRDIPALADLRRVLASAAANESTVLVTAAMALQMAAMPGELDGALAQLEELVARCASIG